MKWNDMSIGKKLATGFGIIIILLVAMGGVSYRCFTLVDHLVQEETEIAKNDQFMLAKTIDHLNWVSKLSDLVFRPDVGSIDIETNDHNCGFGKWLYSDASAHTAEKYPDIAALLDAVKEPHRKLHESAVRIQDTYVHFDRTLDALLAERWIDHLQWMKKLSHSIMSETHFEGGLNPQECAFGKWFYTFEGENDQFNTLIKKWEEPHNRLHQSAAKIVEKMKMADTQGAMEIYKNETSAALEDLSRRYEETMGWIDASLAKQNEAQAIFNNDTLPILSETRGILQSIRNEFSDELTIADEQLTDGMNSTIMFNAIAVIFASLAGITIATLIARNITRPIRKGVEFAEAMSAGDLTRKLDVDQKDEIGVLAASLNSMGSNLRDMFKDISMGVNTITSSSTELSAVSQQMAAGAEQTSGKANQVAAASEQMSSNMTNVAAASEQASTNLQMVAAAAEEMTATIGEITENVGKGSSFTQSAVEQAQKVSNRVNQLGSAATEIGKVTATINDISDQTNLLALNATIEAARAGEAGKGFAVVANEIKELARQTADATQDIRQKIDLIQNSTGETVVEINQIESVIAEINDIVTGMASAVEEQAASTNEISQNINQAASGISDVNENVLQSSTVAAEIAQDISEVDQAASEMEEGSTQINTSAGELSRLAEQLNSMVARFKI